ncbi:hypothetical protein F9362_10150 [Escherichia coli]|uniref:hypothetical protein n=1 Tax=Enterobacteriaceae TaxID=543 RepID=UPI0002A235B9|nr:MULTISPECIES: hypothetical protein [Enterobacteriaceae]HAS0832473.1 hypothetical protein [Enterobacter cloacae subsp. cloacae]EFH4046109.1 hypothetical protein [Escherichia coli]EGW1691029.1 hypothetical protein [Escherichia coli]EIQ2254239.1 hypothetical protein [Escherichia coli]EKK1647772.1 hypothetical protein [Escherichia coli]
MKYAIIENNIVKNLVLWNGKGDLLGVSQRYKVDDDITVNIGDEVRVNNGVLEIVSKYPFFPL